MSRTVWECRRSWYIALERNGRSNVTLCASAQLLLRLSQEIQERYSCKNAIHDSSDHTT